MSGSNKERAFVEPAQLRDLLASGTAVSIVDVRSPEEFAAGHIEGAVNIPAAELADRMGELDEHASIVTVRTLGGARSCGAADQLHALGRRDAVPLRGGARGWHGSNDPEGVGAPG